MRQQASYWSVCCPISHSDLDHRRHSIIQQTPHYEMSMDDSLTPYHSANPTLWSVNGWFVYTLSFSKPHNMKCQWMIRVHPIIQQTPHYEVSMDDSCTPYHSANPTLWSVNGWFVYTLSFSNPHTMKCQWLIRVHPNWCFGHLGHDVWLATSWRIVLDTSQVIVTSISSF